MNVHSTLLPKPDSSADAHLVNDPFGQKCANRINPTFLTYDRKCKVALRRSILTRAIQREQADELLPDDKIMLANLRGYEYGDCRTTSNAYACFLNQIMHNAEDTDFSYYAGKPWINKVFEMAKANVLLQYRLSLQSQEPIVRDLKIRQMREMMATKQPTPLLYALSKAIDTAQNMVNQLAHIEELHGRPAVEKDIQDLIPNCTIKFEPFDITVSWSGELCSIEIGNDTPFLAPRPMVLMIHNKLCDLFSVLLLALYTSGVCYPPNYYDQTVGFVKELTRLSKTFKNNFHTIAAALEGFVVAETLITVDGPENDMLLTTLTEDVRETTNFNYTGSYLQRCLSSAPIEVKHELGCLSKLVGHPYVNTKAGAEKLYKRTHERKELDTSTILSCVHLAKESYVRNHILRHGKWPPVAFLRGRPRHPLLEAWKRNIDPKHTSIIDRFGDYTLAEWNMVEVQENLRFNELDNYLPHLKDRTISVLRSRVVQGLIKKGTQSPPRWEETRLLLYYLMNKNSAIDHHSYLQRYLKSSTLGELIDYLIIRLIAKELEHKDDPRYFGCKTYEDRARMTVQCNNVKHFLDLYSDEQAMTLGELDVIKKLYAFRTLETAYPGHRVLYINLDCSGWNNAFRHETVSMMAAETLDAVFGVDLTRKTHLAYQQAFFYIPDKYDVYYWEGQEGGIEGLDQDTWVWVYINQIKQAMEDYHLHYHVFCKGDDFRLAVLIPPKLVSQKPLIEWQKDIVETISTIVSRCGHKIKIAESYGSPTYFTFSKSASCGRIQLPEGARKIQKTYGANNAFMSTLDDYIASAFSNAHSTCQVMTVSHGPYFVALCWSYYYLLSNKHYSKLTEKQLTATLLIPSMLGGFAVIYLHNMYVRAESDLLSPFLHLVQFSEEVDTEIFNVLKNFLKIKRCKLKNYEQLMIDPYSLPIEKPAGASGILKNTVVRELRRIVRNEQVIELFKSVKSPFSTQVLKCLATADPFPARIFSVIYSALPVGVLRELCARFESGKSVLETVVIRKPGGWKSAKRILLKAMDSDNRLHEWRCNRLSVTSGLITGKDYFTSIKYLCPGEAAQHLRDTLWMKEITSITMPPLSHLVNIYRQPRHQATNHSLNNHFTYVVKSQWNERLSPDCSQHWVTCHEKPFLGHTTRTGQIEPQVHFIEKDPVVLKVKNLLDLRRWCPPTCTLRNGQIVRNNVPDLIDTIINFYTDKGIEDLDKFAARKRSGTDKHHLRSSHFKESIVPNNRSNIYQQITGHSNTHHTLVASGNHYSLNFLHCHCFAVHSIFDDLEYGPKSQASGTYWVETVDCDFCMAPIEQPGTYVDMRSIQGIRVDPILACKITATAREVIQESMTQFAKGEIYVCDTSENLDMLWASTGVLQELVRQTYQNHKDIQTRHTQHSMTSEAQSVLTALSLQTSHRIIGDTEMKRCNIKHLIPALACIVFEFITFKLSRANPSNVTVLLATLPGSEMPWYRLMDKLYSLGRLTEFVNELRKLSKVAVPMVYDNPNTASIYTGQALAVALYNGVVPLRCCVMTYRPIKETVPFIRQLGNALRWKMLREAIDIHVRFGQLPTSDELRMHLSKLVIVALSMDIIGDEELLEMERQMQAGEELEFAISIGGYEAMNADDLKGQPDLGIGMSPEYEYYVNRWPGLPWNEAMEEIIEGNYEDAYESLRKYVLSVPLEMLRTDIGECIEYVRSYSGDTTSSDTETSTDESLHEWKDEQFPKVLSKDKKRNKLRTWRLGQHLGQHLISINNVEGPCLKTRIRYDQAYAYRPFGLGTTSADKLAQIIDALGFSYPLGRYLQCLCLGEGYGGNLDFLARVTRRSTFGFCTIPPSHDSVASPAIAHASLSLGKHVLNDTNMKTGVYDLREPLTQNWFIEHFPQTHIVVCDAELPANAQDDAWKIARTVVNIFLATATAESIFISKCSAHDQHLLCCYTYTLAKAGCKVYICKPPASGMNAELYVCATEYRRLQHHQLGEFSGTYPRNVVHDVLRITNEIFMINFPLVCVDEVRLTLGPPLAVHIHLFPSMEPSYEAKLVAGCGVSLSFDDLSVQRTLSLEDIKKKFLIRLENVADLFLSILTGQRRALKLRQWDDNTHVHYLILAMKWLFVRGCMTVVEKSRKPETTEEDMRRHYESELSILPARCSLAPVTKHHWRTTNFFVSSKTINPFFRFMQGIRCGQMFLSYTQCYSSWSYSRSYLYTESFDSASAASDWAA